MYSYMRKGPSSEYEDTRGGERRFLLSQHCVTPEASLDGTSRSMINENRDLRYKLKMNIDGLIVQGV
jgi:hypothetical protein